MGNQFYNELEGIKSEQKRFQTRMLNANAKKELLDTFERAKRRILLLDYDGTLVPFVGDPAKAAPPAELLKLLQELSEIDGVDIVIISGRERAVLQSWLEDLDAGFVAEHGVWIKEKGKDWELLRPVSSDWKRELLPLLMQYADKVPGSFVEEKEYSQAGIIVGRPRTRRRCSKELTIFCCDLLLIRMFR